MRTKPWVLLLAAALFLVPPAGAYPIPPATLWELSHRSERIVYAEVVRHPSDDVARLRVLETWRGSPTKELDVHYEPGLVCPAPPVYADGKRVVAFLAQWEGHWRTVALSYGTRYPADARELEDLRMVVADAVKRLPPYTRRASDYDAEPPRPPRDWALLAATLPATRWDGLYVLAADADTPHARYDYRRREKGTLTAEQKRRLAESFVAAPSRDHTVPMLLTALEGFPSKELDAAITSVLDDVIREEPPYWAHEALQLFRARLGAALKPERAEPDELARTMADAAGNYAMEERSDFNERISREWSELKRQFALEARPLPPAVERPVRGVGGETPL